MTIRMPHISIGDRVLKALGKKRGFRLPTEAYEKFGPYVSAVAQKECFWRALVRAKDSNLPNGYADLFSFDPDDHDQRPNNY